jgi:protein-S-isoprenylcysteine O-methyltransferase Ste14
MFFLAGLGLLNVVWLPVLDVSFGLSGLGAVIRAPYDFLRWAFGLFGVSGYWPIVYFFIGSGLLIFFLGTLAWLQARARKEGVAVSWVYRISRHPQYLGWIIWSYGIYLLLLQARYPRRSWGISASLPWLISTMVIIGVAMLEELSMRKRHGEVYESYRRSAPFLFPVPGFVERIFALPQRLLFGKERPDRRREVAAVLALYAALLIGASFLFYGNGLEHLSSALRSEQAQQEHLARLVTEIRQEENWRRQNSLTRSLGMYGDAGVDVLVEFLRGEDTGLCTYAAETLRDYPSIRGLDALIECTRHPHEDVRWKAGQALGALGSLEVKDPLLALLADSVSYIRFSALQSLANLGATEVISVAKELTRSDQVRERAEGVRALGSLGSTEGLPTLSDCVTDKESWVREEAIIALLRIGSQDAIPALRRALEDEDRQLRMYAEEALKRIRS